MLKTFYVDRLFDGDDFKQSQRITVKNDKVIAVVAGKAQPTDIHLKGLVVPGFIDVQVNGGGGVLFNTQPDIEALGCIARAHQKYGTTTMLPTLITDSYTQMQQAAAAMADAIANGVDGIAGIHFEGPHLSEPKKGIHPQQHVRAISDRELALFLRKDIGQVMVTLAPEIIPTEVIKELVQNDVIVCLGHSNATSAQVNSALKCGATGFTHLFNAMSPLTSREPGMVGAALLDDNSFCGLIVDHFHVHQQSCQLAVKCKGAEHIMLVTDAMSHVGSNQVTATFAGMEIKRQGNKLTIEGGRLAGSSLDMASAVRNTHQDLNIGLADSLNMASLTPAKFLKINQHKGKIATHYFADWVALDEQQQVLETWISGKQVYARATQN